MCGPEAVLMAVGTGIQMKAIKEQGKAEEKIARVNAGQAIIDKTQSDLETAQFTNDRLQKYKNDMDTNEAIFAFLGRDTPASFIESQKLSTYTDINRQRLRGDLQGSQSLSEANANLLKGKYARKTASVQAQTALLSGFSKIIETSG